MVGIGRGIAARFFVAAAAVLTALSSTAAGSAEAEEDRRPCFHACFDQCVPRDEFWFCQITCYHRCAGSYRVFAPPGRLGCEQWCARSLCAELRPGSKIMAACRDTCRKSYAVAACRMYDRQE